MKNLDHPKNFSIVWKVLYSGKRFFRQRQKRFHSLKSSFQNVKWFHNHWWRWYFRHWNIIHKNKDIFTPVSFCFLGSGFLGLKKVVLRIVILNKFGTQMHQTSSREKNTQNSSCPVGQLGRILSSHAHQDSGKHWFVLALCFPYSQINV